MKGTTTKAAYTAAWTLVRTVATAAVTAAHAAEETLANAPRREDDYFRVRVVLE